MFICSVFLAVSSVMVLRDVHVSGCDQNCADKPEFSPSRLVVKHGDPASASCSVCHQDCVGNLFNVETPVGSLTRNGTTVSWTVDSLTQWKISPLCYYTNAAGHQCCTALPVTVYKPPDDVSISFFNHTGPMVEGHHYSLQCVVKEVAPVENLIVTFHRGQTELTQRRFNDHKAGKKPETRETRLQISPHKEDDGVQYWCEARLELGPEGPQPPPVVMSQNMTVTVHYKPQIQAPSGPIIITEGELLQLKCSAVGNPRPSYTWTLPSGNSSVSSSVLTINSVTSADKGQYTCSVSNTLGTVPVTFDVDVQVSSLGIILGVIAAVALLVVVSGLIGYACCYRPNRVGEYNLKDVFRLHRQHVAVPTGE